MQTCETIYPQLVSLYDIEEDVLNGTRHYLKGKSTKSIIFQNHLMRIQTKSILWKTAREWREKRLI